MTSLAEPGTLKSGGRARGEETELPGVGVLLRNELLKTRRRMAFWVALLFFLLLVFIQSFEALYRALTSSDPSAFRLPSAWDDIILDPGPMAGLFAATTILLLVGSEWRWKTARQNVIDGLSKDQWFVGKALLMVLLALTFLAGQVVLAGGMAAWNTDFVAGPVLRAQDLLMMAGVLTLTLGYMSIAFAFAFAVRSVGSAIGLFFIYIAAVEPLLGAALGRWEWSRPVARYLPRTVFDLFFRADQYSLARQAARIERAEQRGLPTPEYFDTGFAFALAGAWIAAFVLAAYVAHRRRDL